MDILSQLIIQVFSEDSSKTNYCWASKNSQDDVDLLNPPFVQELLAILYLRATIIGDSQDECSPTGSAGWYQHINPRPALHQRETSLKTSLGRNLSLSTDSPPCINPYLEDRET